MDRGRQEEDAPRRGDHPVSVRGPPASGRAQWEGRPRPPGGDARRPAAGPDGRPPARGDPRRPRGVVFRYLRPPDAQPGPHRLLHPAHLHLPGPSGRRAHNRGGCTPVRDMARISRPRGRRREPRRTLELRDLGRLRHHADAAPGAAAQVHPAAPVLRPMDQSEEPGRLSAALQPGTKGRAPELRRISGSQMGGTGAQRFR
mmetsp:Transcript_20251/g.40408  ORF Transcript_20251/g.40408 Transcript_20251/m.40408 type:complete len:201 (+) Transcript_20251:586-1188(+)